MGLFSWFKKKQVEAQTPDEITPKGDYESNYRDLSEGYTSADPYVKKEPTFKIKAIFSNSVLTVFLPGGDALVNTGATKELFNQVIKATSEEEIRVLMLDKEAIKQGEKEERERENLVPDSELEEALPAFVETGEFIEKEGALYLKGIDVSIPRLLAKEILKAGKKDTDEYYESLKNFWCWCVLNPDPIAREDLFGFLERGDFKITRNGFFLGYRNVAEKQGKQTSGDESLTAFISDKYLNIKTKQKKSPKNYEVYVDSEGGLHLLKGIQINTTGRVGNLAELYNNLSTLEDNEYTDAHTRTMSIKIGIPVKMERDACDHNPHSECSRGLHIGNKAFGYQSFGSTTILVAVNPMNVVAVPKHDANKMRTCEYMPLGVLVGSDKTWLEDIDSLSIEEGYAATEAKNLMELAKSSGAKEIEAKKLLGGATLVKQVVETLDIGAAISARVKEV